MSNEKRRQQSVVSSSFLIADVEELGSVIRHGKLAKDWLGCCR